jgi:hypothetical protein
MTGMELIIKKQAVCIEIINKWNEKAYELAAHFGLCQLEYLIRN